MCDMTLCVSLVVLNICTMYDHVRFEFDGEINKVYLSGEDVSGAIRTAETSEGASKIAALPSVRAGLLELQRSLASREPGAVLEGRDIGTVVLPGALFRGKPVAFCALFDFVGMRLGSFFTQAEAATAGALFGAGECIVPAVAPLENKTYSGVARAMSAWDSKPYVCVPFETLAQLAFKLHLPEWAFVCNPTSEAVRSTHVCRASSKRNKAVSLHHGRKKGGKLGRKAPRKKNTHGQTSRTTHRGRHFRREEHPKGEREEESHGLMRLIRRAFLSG